MRVILLGPPGAGKGTQSQKLGQAFDLLQIATGDILRAAVKAQTPLGLEVKSCMEQGQLVPDDLIINLVKDRLTQADAQHGCLFDGFPRTVVQAQAIEDAGIRIDYVIEIAVDDEQLVKRITGRRIHEASGRVYHIDNNPPKKQGFDDVTGEPLVQRADDTEETIRARLKAYHEQTAALVGFYKSLSEKPGSNIVCASVDGCQPMAEVTAELFSILKTPQVTQ